MKVPILDQDYEILSVADIYDSDGDRLFGDVDHAIGRIRLDERLTPEMWKEVLGHELGHIVLFRQGHRPDEKGMLSVENILNAFGLWMRQSGIIDFLVEGDEE